MWKMERSSERSRFIICSLWSHSEDVGRGRRFIWDTQRKCENLEGIRLSSGSWWPMSTCGYKLCTNWSVYLMNLFQFIIFVCFESQKHDRVVLGNGKIAVDEFVQLVKKVVILRERKLKIHEKNSCHWYFSEHEIELYVKIKILHRLAIKFFHHFNLHERGRYWNKRTVEAAAVMNSKNWINKVCIFSIFFVHSYSLYIWL